MKYNKKGIIILASISIIAAILGIISTILMINYTKKINITEAYTFSEFREEEKNDNNNDIEEDDDENNSENEIEQEENKKDTSSQNNTTKPNTTTSTSNENYYIKVNIQANVVTIYKKDSEGNYTIPVKAMVCSTGTATPTSGVYSTTNKYEWRLLIGNVYGQYATRIVGSILFHSVPYTKQNPANLEYWEYDKLGTKASAGCIRLTVADAKWIYDNCKSGTKVEFYSDSNPGPLGKPTAQKISNADENVRGWDPTDPKSNNPWKTYNSNKVENEPIEDNKENTITENTTTENITNNTTTENKPVKDENNNTQTENKTEENTTNSTQTENKTEETTTNNTQTENKLEENTTNNIQTENKLEENTTNNIQTENKIKENKKENI